MPYPFNGSRRSPRTQDANGRQRRPSSLTSMLLGSGATLEVRDLARLLLGALLRIGELLLGLTLPLLLAALGAHRGIAGQVAGGLLRASRELVDDAHLCSLPSSGAAWSYPDWTARKPG